MNHQINRRKEFFAPVRNDPIGYVVMLFFALFQASFTIGVVVVLERIAQAVEVGSQKSRKQRLIILSAMVIAWFVYRLLFKIRNFRVVRDTGIFVDSRYLKKYIEADNNETERVGTGRIISLHKKGILVWLDMVTDMFWGYARRVFTIIFATWLVAQKGMFFLLVAILLYVVIVIRVLVVGPKAASWRRKAKGVETEVDRLFVRRMMSKFEIMQQGKYEHEVAKTYALNHERYGYKIYEKMRQALCYDGAGVLGYIFLVVVVGFVGLQVLQGQQTFADFVLVMGVATTITKVVNDSATIGKAVSDNIVHLEKFRDLFDAIHADSIGKGGCAFVYKTGDISIDTISYGYGSDTMVFDQFSCTMQGGKKTALVGESGSGKSTLIKLIAGYLTPNQGNIIVDGQALESTDLQSYYAHIGYLTQDPSVFDGTIRENLTYALPEADSLISSSLQLESEITKVIRLAKCDFIRDFPDGLHTEIGERGIRLSGGQRQRLAIAKIMLKNPPIILLDEPTSALDSLSEEMVTQAMNNLFRGRTVIVIAHRLQTVKAADNIIVLDQGQIVERGTHDQLVALGGQYARMLELQSGF